MKKISLYSLLCVAMMFCSVSLMAQPQQRPGGGERGRGMKSIDPVEMAEKKTDMMAKQLGLSESQKKSLYSINLKSAEELKSSMEARKATQEVEVKRRKEQAKKREEYTKRVMAILNDKQKLGYAEMMSKVGAAGRGGQGGKPGVAPEGKPQRAQQGAAPQKGGAPQMAQRGGKRGAGAPQGGESIDPVAMAEKLTDKMVEKLELSASQQKKILVLNVEQTTAMRDELEVRKLEQKAREAERTEVKAKREKYNLDVMALLNEEQKIEYAEMVSKMNSRQGGAKQQGGKRGGNGAPQPQQGKRPAAN